MINVKETNETRINSVLPQLERSAILRFQSLFGSSLDFLICRETIHCLHEQLRY